VIIVASNQLAAMRIEEMVDELFADDLRRHAARMMLASELNNSKMDEIREAMRRKFPRALETRGRTAMEALLHEVRLAIESRLSKG
jgi:hypothetical protein